MEKTTPPKEERSTQYSKHSNSPSCTGAATSRTSMAFAQDSQVGAINELNTMAEQLLSDVARASSSVATPA
ncbi:hypothetical protein B2J73_16170 [Stutzerimonas stutzeri]|nr:hypothetical protein B2J73_16170 [Stutzerimonas stutzeri]TFZ24173.1 hypothetical protein AK6_05230 [Stutzerimonas stutzeri]CAB5521574.1 Uncharacterised protein [Stutzerimonas stutzeri]CAB5544556.1 Uncharacterised protein [Stutzerimonas stutzeri]CAC9069708.1 Uncharacterised protein [Stutzerimonas stutzeri]